MFKGSVVAMVTPMLDDKVDVRRLQELVEFHIASGTHAIVAAGTTGEAGSLSRDEKLLVIKTVIDQARERIPIIAGTAANATKDTIMLSQMALELGVHALLIMTPYYIKPTQEGLYQHFSQIAHAVPIPIILYNVPSRTGCDLLPETVARLACISNIVGIKEATGQMCRLQDILHASQGSIDVYSGDDLTAAEWMMAGAKAVISVTANVAPILLAKMCDAALDQDRVTCLSIHEELRSLSELMFCESNPIPVKWALHKMGMMSDEIRLPMTHLSTEYHQKLHQVMVKLHLL